MKIEGGGDHGKIQRSRGEKKQALHAWTLIATLYFLCSSMALADAPYDIYYIQASDIHHEVRRDAVGVFSITFPGTFLNFKERKNGVVEIAGRRWLFVSNWRTINTYLPVSGGFKADGALSAAETGTPVNWLYTEDERNGANAYPVVNTRGEYCRILYGPSRGRSAWIRPSEIPTLTDRVFIPGVARIETYARRSGAFVPDGDLDVMDIVPVNGCRWYDELSDQTRTLKMPIVGVQGDFRQIVYDPIRNSRAWIHLTRLVELMKPLTWYQPGDDFFTEKLFGRNPPESLYVDLFFFIKSRKLYKAPDESAPFELITPETKEPSDPLGYTNYGSGTVTRIRNGFALLCFIDACTGKVMPLGWIKLRDEGGKITIWTVIPLSC